MKLLNHELKLSISLDEKTCVNAKAFSAAGYEAAECDLPVDYFAPVDLSIFPPFLEKVCPAIEEAGLRITTFHLPFGTFWDISSPDEAVRTAAVAASAELLKMLAPYAGENIVVHPSFEPIAEEAREAHIAACRKSLAELGPIAAKCGKKIALENLPRTCLGRTDGRRRAVRRLHGHDPHVPRNAPAVHAALRKVDHQHPSVGLSQRSERVPLGARHRQSELEGDPSEPD